MSRLLRAATLVLFLVTVVSGSARAQAPEHGRRDSVRTAVERPDVLSSREGAVTAGLGFGAVSRGLMVGAEAAYHVDGEFVALRAAMDPDRGRYAEYVDRAPAVKPGVVFQRYEASVVLGTEGRVGPAFLGVDAGLGVVGPSTCSGVC